MTTSLAHLSISERPAQASRPEASRGRIGPNAAIQLIRVMPLSADPETVRRILAAADALDWATRAPAEMVDERKVAALHRATRAILPAEDARALLAKAGALTGDYILANRIPAWARAVLKPLPAGVSSRLLVPAIAAHAWTFVGSGQFACDRTDGLRLDIASNPLCLGEKSAKPICAWHAAVFQRLFEQLVSPRAHVVETRCCAQGDLCCSFAINGIR